MGFKDELKLRLNIDPPTESQRTEARERDAGTGEKETEAPPSSTEPTAVPSRSGMSGSVQRHPLRWVWGGVALALLVGIGIGAATSEGEDTERIDEAEERADQLASELESAREETAELSSQLEEITAEGEAPDFTGMSIEEARGHALVERFDWTVRTQDQPSDEAPGAVLAQRPAAGTVLARGASIHLAVATERPAEWRTAFERSGAGSTRTDEFELTSERIRIRYSFTGGTNAILQLKQPGEDFGELLLNEIGDFDDTTRVYTDPGTYYLEIDGGSWSVTVEEYR